MVAYGQTVSMWRHLPSISPRRNSGAARSAASSNWSGGTTIVIASALDALFGNEVEADVAAPAVDQLRQRGVGRRLRRSVAELQHVLACIRRIELELAHGPLLDGAHAGAGREGAVDGAVHVVDRDFDLLAAGHVDARAVLEA